MIGDAFYTVWTEKTGGDLLSQADYGKGAVIGIEHRTPCYRANFLLASRPACLAGHRKALTRSIGILEQPGCLYMSLGARSTV